MMNLPLSSRSCTAPASQRRPSVTAATKPPLCTDTVWLMSCWVESLQSREVLGRVLTCCDFTSHGEKRKPVRSCQGVPERGHSNIVAEIQRCRRRGRSRVITFAHLQLAVHGEGQLPHMVIALREALQPQLLTLQLRLPGDILGKTSPRLGTGDGRNLEAGSSTCVTMSTFALRTSSL